jgi:tRNA dimethylallyltransferase
MERVIVIIGPTAVGKTKISIDLARRLETEIISGDSMLIYKGMDIGTAKPTLEERSGVPHHLIDILEPAQAFSVTDFQDLAGRQISAVNQQGKIPILAGGTGLYVKALLEGYTFNATPANNKLRSELENMAAVHGNEFLHEKLSQVAPADAGRLHPNDLRRIVRALEIHYLGAGQTNPPAQTAEKEGLVYDAAVMGLSLDRAVLYERINRRVELMLENGLIEEVSLLLNEGVPPNAQAMQGIGYKEIISYLQGDADLATAVENIKKATRHFAKRQLTWYRKMPYIQWFDVSQYSSYDSLLETFYKYVAGKFTI